MKIVLDTAGGLKLTLPFRVDARCFYLRLFGITENPIANHLMVIEKIAVRHEYVSFCTSFKIINLMILM